MLATVEGLMYKEDAWWLYEEGKLNLSNPHFNEGYSEVELTNVPLQMSFSFRFHADSSEYEEFEITELSAS